MSDECLKSYSQTLQWVCCSGVTLFYENKTQFDRAEVLLHHAYFSFHLPYRNIFLFTVKDGQIALEYEKNVRK